MPDLEELGGRVVQALGESLVCLFFMGSRSRGDEREESDYDFIAIVSELSEERMLAMREAFSHLSGLSIYVLDGDDVRTLPKAEFLEFTRSRKLYGDFEYALPSKKDVLDYVVFCCREQLDAMRHYIILPHTNEKLGSVLYPSLKRASFYLSYLAYVQTGKLPMTRKDLLSYLESIGGHQLEIRMMRILVDWDSHEDEYLRNPLPLLLQIEALYRTLRV